MNNIISAISLKYSANAFKMSSKNEIPVICVQIVVV